MQKPAAFAALTLCVVVWGCGSKELTRVKAAELIRQMTANPEGGEHSQEYFEFQEAEDGFSSDTAVIDQYQRLEKTGLIALAVGECSLFGCHYKATLTDSGKLAARRWTKNQFNIWQIPQMKRELIEVTRVTMVAPDMAVAECTGRWAPTEVGRQFGLEQSKVERWSVNFQLLNDEWAIAP
ncbi:MAG: hypothetical protein JO099_19650 [Acidobacteriia bacterium]|nr:hypothetical protein [Terriglobia bacterium]